LTRLKKYGLIGYPLSHTFSPNYFAEKFIKEDINDVRYEAYELQKIEDIKLLFENEIDGLNVTIPYKEKVIPFLDGLDESAEKIGAVNTIKRNGNKYVGYNTDVIGFEKSIEPLLRKGAIKKSLILGTGGASKAIEFALKNLGFECLKVSRTQGDLLYSELNKKRLNDVSIIINTTPIGMYPNTDSAPSIPYRFLSENHLVYDVIYNPEKTLFLVKAEHQGARIKNGKEMLILQAEASWSIWNS